MPNAGLSEGWPLLITETEFLNTSLYYLSYNCLPSTWGSKRKRGEGPLMHMQLAPPSGLKPHVTVLGLFLFHKIK